MTPAARIAAAAEVLDEIGTMGRAEPALKAWSRGNRYAGSKDRAAMVQLCLKPMSKRPWRKRLK